jgi:hypothetical protein
MVEKEKTNFLLRELPVSTEQSQRESTPKNGTTTKMR